jgi:hypothetical protein
MRPPLPFGEQVEGLPVPVLNEREIRAAAGILFLATFLALMFILFRGNFIPIKVVIPAFFADLLVRILNPRLAPSLILGRLIVAGQTPEYVAAAPKRLAWGIGLALSGLMLVLMVAMNTYGPISGITCLVCLVFLFCEAAFGICLGCKFYALVYGQPPTLCPGEVCSPRDRSPVQRISPLQAIVLLGFLALVAGATVAFQGRLAAKPRPLFAPPGT